VKTNTVHEKAKDSNGQILHDGETECDIENPPLVLHMKTHYDNMFQYKLETSSPHLFAIEVHK